MDPETYLHGSIVIEASKPAHRGDNPTGSRPSNHPNEKRNTCPSHNAQQPRDKNKPLAILFLGIYPNNSGEEQIFEHTWWLLSYHRLFMMANNWKPPVGLVAREEPSRAWLWPYDGWLKTKNAHNTNVNMKGRVYTQ